MLKINVSFSKKIPGEEQYSSLSFHGSMEKELSDGLNAEQIQQAFHNSYQLLEATVEQEIQNYKGKQTNPVQSAKPAYAIPAKPYQAPQSSAPQANQQQASQKQITFLNRLGAERGLSQQQVDAMALNSFGANSIWQLTKKQASQLIEQLQNQRVA